MRHHPAWDFWIFLLEVSAMGSHQISMVARGAKAEMLEHWEQVGSTTLPVDLHSVILKNIYENNRFLGFDLEKYWRLSMLIIKIYATMCHKFSGRYLLKQACTSPKSKIDNQKMMGFGNS